MKAYQKPQIVEKIQTTISTKNLYAWQLSIFKWMLENKSVPYRFVITPTLAENDTIEM